MLDLIEQIKPELINIDHFDLLRRKCLNQTGKVYY